MKRKVYGIWVYKKVQPNEVKKLQAKGWHKCPEAEAIAALSSGK